MDKIKDLPPETVQIAALLAIGEILDEIFCHLKDIPIDETHHIFGMKLNHHIDGLYTPSGNRK